MSILHKIGRQMDLYKMLLMNFVWKLPACIEKLEYCKLQIAFNSMNN